MVNIKIDQANESILDQLAVVLTDLRKVEGRLNNIWIKHREEIKKLEREVDYGKKRG